jgi:hypothetical protein
MIANIAQSLPQAVGDLFQCIPLEGVQLNGGEMAWGEEFPEPGGRFLSPNRFKRALGR